MIKVSEKIFDTHWNVIKTMYPKSKLQQNTLFRVVEYVDKPDTINSDYMEWMNQLRKQLLELKVDLIAQAKLEAYIYCERFTRKDIRFLIDKTEKELKAKPLEQRGKNDKNS